MTIREREMNEDLLQVLIGLSEDWEKENSTWGYRKNEREDLKNRRIFTAEEDGEILAYLFGRIEETARRNSFVREGTPVFELEELYVRPEYRNRSLGRQLFRYAEEILKKDTDWIFLSTATRNYKAILHFYIEEVGMEFWSARLCKKIGR